MLSDAVVAQTKRILGEMRDPVGVTLFTQEQECSACRPIADFLAEMAAVEPRLQVERKDFLADRELAAELKIHHVPAFALRRPGAARFPVRYYGMPSGYEFGAFLKTLLLFSAGSVIEGLEAAALGGVTAETNLKVFVLGA
jgi:alkyl hydroperoxide reductase subunit AhpF